MLVPRSKGQESLCKVRLRICIAGEGEIAGALRAAFRQFFKNVSQSLVNEHVGKILIDKIEKKDIYYIKNYHYSYVCKRILLLENNINHILKLYLTV
jgi:hypothetical protein